MYDIHDIYILVKSMRREKQTYMICFNNRGDLKQVCKSSKDSFLRNHKNFLSQDDDIAKETSFAYIHTYIHTYHNLEQCIFE